MLGFKIIAKFKVYLYMASVVSFGSTLQEVVGWYKNIPFELEAGHLNAVQKKYVYDYYHEAGLLREWRRPFFEQHFAKNFWRAVNYLEPSSEKKILDLGCGVGTQSLHFALLGAKVVAVDLDEVALDILNQRKMFYESYFGKKLNITCCCGDSFKVDYGKLAPFDCVYSMFAFNMMQPSNRLLEILVGNLSRKARIAILDGNSGSLISRLIPSRRRKVLSPVGLRQAVEKLGFVVDQHHSGVVLPPLLWKVLPTCIASFADNKLGNNWIAALSHQILAQRS